MRKMKILIATGMFFMGGLLFTSCNNTNDTEETKKIEESTSSTKYICPMECEGDKTYDEPGKCPVCKMDIISFEEFEKIRV